MAASYLHQPVSTTEVHMRKAENGFVIEVDFPESMTRKDDVKMDLVSSIFGEFGKSFNSEDPEASDPHNVMKMFQNVVQKAKDAQNAKPLRKPHEEYVFMTLEQTMAFIKELFETNDS